MDDPTDTHIGMLQRGDAVVMQKNDDRFSKLRVNVEQVRRYENRRVGSMRVMCLRSSWLDNSIVDLESKKRLIDFAYTYLLFD